MKKLVNLLAERPHGATKHVSVFGLQFMQASIGIGVVCFAAFVLFTHLSGAFTQEHALPADFNAIRVLSQVSLAVGAGAYLLAIFLPRFPLRRKQFPPADLPANPTEQERADLFYRYLRDVLRQRELRLTLLEIPALLGLVVCMLAEMWNVLPGQPIYFAGYSATAVFLAYVVLTFPRRSRLESQFAAALARAAKAAENTGEHQ